MARSSLPPALEISEGSGLLAVRWTSRFGAMQLRGLAAVGGCVRVLARTGGGEEIVDVDAGSGEVVARRPAPQPLVGVSVFADGWIVGTTYRGRDEHRQLMFIDPDGNVAAQYPKGDSLFRYGEQAGALHVLVGRDGHLRAYREGVLEWTHPIAGPEGAKSGGPLSADDRMVVICSWGTAYAVNPDGSERWTWRLPIQVAAGREIDADEYDERAQARDDLGQKLRQVLGRGVDEHVSSRWDRSDRHSRATADGHVLSADAAARITDVHLCADAVWLGDSDSRVWTLDRAGQVLSVDRICDEATPVRLLIDGERDMRGAIADSTVAALHEGRVAQTGRISGDMARGVALRGLLVAWDSFTIVACDLERNLRFRAKPSAMAFDYALVDGLLVLSVGCRLVGLGEA